MKADKNHLALNRALSAAAVAGRSAIE